MRLTLSSNEQRLLASTAAALASPLEYEDVGLWAREVNARAKALTGADRAALVLPRPAAPIDFLTTDYDPATFGVYPEVTSTLDRRTQVLDRAASLEAFNRRLLWSDHPDYFRSAHFNEYVIPFQLFDTVGIAAPVASKVEVRTLAKYYVHNERPRGPAFEERNLALFRLLSPAFRNGVRMCVRLQQWRRELSRMLDTVADGMLLCDRDGRVVHENTALLARLSVDPEAERVRSEASRLARTIATAAERGAASSGFVAPSNVVIRTAVTHYHLYAGRVSESLFAPGVCTVVCVEPTGARAESAESLRERFGLTKRQAQIALLIGKRMTNREIADALGISYHTAKRHTEQVLLKLGVTSRTEVAEKVRRT